MKGAREYAHLFKTGQYGRLYIISASHARGSTFNIYVLPEGWTLQAAHGPFLDNAVEVYGILGGNPGWTEWYGWLHEGPWQEDFYQLVKTRKAQLEHQRQLEAQAYQDVKDAEERRIATILASYPSSTNNRT